MPVKMTVKSNWKDDIAKSMKLGLLEMAVDIHKRAIILAPKDTRALVNSGIIEPVTDGYRVKFGNARVPYARRRHFENLKHPQTLGYLARAGDSVSRGNTSKYFSGKIS